MQRKSSQWPHTTTTNVWPATSLQKRKGVMMWWWNLWISRLVLSTHLVSEWVYNVCVCSGNKLYIVTMMNCETRNYYYIIIWQYLSRVIVDTYHSSAYTKGLSLSGLPPILRRRGSERGGGGGRGGGGVKETLSSDENKVHLDKSNILLLGPTGSGMPTSLLIQLLQWSTFSVTTWHIYHVITHFLPLLQVKLCWPTRWPAVWMCPWWSVTAPHSHRLDMWEMILNRS